MTESAPLENTQTLNQYLRQVGLDDIKWIDFFTNTFTLKDGRLMLEDVIGGFALLDKKASKRSDKNALTELKTLLSEISVPYIDVKSLSKNAASDPSSYAMSHSSPNTDHNAENANLINRANGGQLLYGLLYDGEKVISSRSPQKVLAPYTAVELMKPEMKMTDRTEQLMSAQEIENIKKQMFSWGIGLSRTSAATETTGSAANEQRETSKTATGLHGTLRSARQSNKRKNESAQDYYRWRFLCIPKVSFDIRSTHKRLSGSAIEKLKCIDDDLQAGIDTNNSIDEFLKSYGSHIHTGVMHLGGTHEEKCNVSTASERRAKKHKHVIGISLGIGEQKTNLKGMAEMLSAGRQQETNKSDRSKVNKTTEGHGGKTFESVERWRNTIEQDREAWQIIDLGDQFEPLWKIVEECVVHFENSRRLALALYRRWKTRICVREEPSADFEANLRRRNADETFKNLISVLKQSTNDVDDFESSCIDCLKRIASALEMFTAMQSTLLSDSPEFIAFSEHMYRHLNEISMVGLSVVSQWLSKVMLSGHIKNAWLSELQNRINGILKETSPHAEDVKDLASLNFAMSKYADSIRNMSADCDSIMLNANLMFTAFFETTNADIYEKTFMSIMAYKYQYTYCTGFKTFSLESLSEVLEAVAEFFLLPGHNQCKDAFMFRLAIEATDKLSFCDRQQQVMSLTKELRKHSDTSISNNIQIWLESSKDLTELERTLLECQNNIDVDFALYNTTNIGNPMNRDAEIDDVQTQAKFGATIKPLKDTPHFDLFRRLGITVDNAPQNDRFNVHNVLLVLDSKEVSPCPDGLQCIRDTVLLKYNRNKTYKVMQSQTVERATSRKRGSRPPQTVHDMDVTVALWSFSDNIVTQLLAEKTYQKRHAIPFILPQLIEDGKTHRVLLWPLRAIVPEWRVPNKSTSTGLTLVNIEHPIIAFVRIGEINVSKSRLLNMMLFEEKVESFCIRNSSADSLADGLVELAWVLPAAGDEWSVDNMLTFANLRGDARRHPALVECLRAMSSLVVILIDYKSVRDKSYKDAFQFGSDVGTNEYILAVEMKQEEDEDTDNTIASCASCLSELFGQYQTASSGDQGEDDVASEPDNWWTFDCDEKQLAVTLRNFLKECIPRLSPQSLHSCTKLTAFDCEIDESDAKVSQAVEDLHIISDLIYRNDKNSLLPLQGKFWSKWCSTDRVAQRRDGIGDMAEACFLAEKHAEKQMQRKYQFDHYINMPTAMQHIWHVFSKYRKEDVSYFCRWLNIQFSERSRQMKLEKGAKGEEIGLVHILREIGQIYECVHDFDLSPEDAREYVSFLPDVMAKLLLNGIQLELMDGDVSYVPQKWVAAILESLREALGGRNHKVFVLSVVGIQSSGKSTLLNTMFGLQFATSSGRCTTGVNCRLVQIDKQSTGLNCDYLLIVDTEGLRSAQSNRQHDNELATFAIGIGNATIVNIKGESYSEMRDILEIVVHAFIRMMRYNRKINLCPRCVFVHQNVSAVDAKSATANERDKLEQLLNEATINAAHDEFDDENRVTNVNDVIKFSKDEDVFFLPDLWYGSPPMAPVSHDYVRQVSELKAYLLNSVIKANESSCITFADISSKVCDIWDAITSNTIDTHCVNSLQVRAFNEAEKIYLEKKWKLDEVVYELHSAIECRVSRAREWDMKNLRITIGKEVNTKLKFQVDGLKNELSEQFASAQYGNLVPQLQTMYIDQLDRDWLSHRSTLYNVIKSKYTLKTTELKYGKELEPLKSKLHDSIFGEIPQLVGNLNDETVYANFNRLWFAAITEIMKCAKTRPHVDDMDAAFELERRNSIEAITGQKQQSELTQEIHLDNSTSIPDVKEDDIKCIGTLIDPRTWKRRGSQKPADVANECVRRAVNKIDSYCQSLGVQQLSKTHVVKLFSLLKTELFERFIDTTNKKYELRTNYKTRAVFSLYAAKLSAFKNIQEQFIRKTDPRAMLQLHYEPWRNEFEIAYKQSQTEKNDALARHILEHLLDFVRKETLTSVRLSIRKSMRKEKRALVKDTLTEAGTRAEEGNLPFDELKRCILHFNDYVTERLHVKARNEWFNRNGSNETPFGKEASKLVKDHYDKFIKLIESDDVCDMSSLQSLLARELQLSTSNSSVECLNFTSVKSYILNNVSISTTSLCGEFCAMKDFNAFVAFKCDSPVDESFTSTLLGCKHTCPACHAPCVHSLPDHDGKHIPLMHYPLCLVGVCYPDNNCNMLIMDSCTVFDSSRLSFRYADLKESTDGKETVIEKKWKLIFSKQTSSKMIQWNHDGGQSFDRTCYGNWLVVKYAADIKKEYNKKELFIPEKGFHEVTWTKAKESLDMSTRQ